MGVVSTLALDALQWPEGIGKQRIAEQDEQQARGLICP